MKPKEEPRKLLRSPIVQALMEAIEEQVKAECRDIGVEYKLLAFTVVADDRSTCAIIGDCGCPYCALIAVTTMGEVCRGLPAVSAKAKTGSHKGQAH